MTAFSFISVFFAFIMLTFAFNLPFVVSLSLALIWCLFHLYVLTGLEWWARNKVTQARFDPIAVGFWKAVRNFLVYLSLVPQGTVLAGAAYVVYSYFA